MEKWQRDNHKLEEMKI